MMKTILDHTTVVKALTDVETDRNGGAITGDWIDMSQYDAVVIVMQAGALGANIVTQVEQATTDGGTEKDISGKTVTFTNGTDENALKTLEVHADELDTANDYRWIRIQADDPGSASTYLAASYFMFRARYPQDTMDDPTS